MTIKIFVPDIGSSQNTKLYTPLLYPTFNKSQSVIGCWSDKIQYVSSIKECDIVSPALYVDQYFIKKEHTFLDNLYNEAEKENKLFICFTGGDHGITLPYEQMHLYRTGGYFSKNKGNQFAFPTFFPDPVDKFFGGEILFNTKTLKPLIGFCGQGATTPRKIIVDYLRALKRRAAHEMGFNFYDAEVLGSPTTTRAALLDRLEKSDLIDTNFIRHKKYRAGLKNKSTKEGSTKMFYENMVNTQYNLCYRGNGNFSVRLFETLACGRIPIIVKSDNNMILPDKIDWNAFPVVNEKSYMNVDKIVAGFHDNLTSKDFTALQIKARQIWLSYLSYEGYMSSMVERYIEMKKTLSATDIHQHLVKLKKRSFQ